MGGVAFTLGARDFKGVQAVLTYQEVTGTLNPGAHPGGYNGQDAYNDMLVVDDEILGRNTSVRHDLREKRGGGGHNGCLTKKTLIA